MNAPEAVESWGFQSKMINNEGNPPDPGSVEHFRMNIETNWSGSLRTQKLPPTSSVGEMILTNKC